MIVALGLVMPATGMVADATDDSGGESGESLDADPALLAKALGSESTEGCRSRAGSDRTGRHAGR